MNVESISGFRRAVGRDSLPWKKRVGAGGGSLLQKSPKGRSTDRRCAQLWNTLLKRISHSSQTRVYRPNHGTASLGTRKGRWLPPLGAD